MRLDIASQLRRGRHALVLDGTQLTGMQARGVTGLEGKTWRTLLDSCTRAANHHLGGAMKRDGRAKRAKTASLTLYCLQLPVFFYSFY